MQAPPAAPGRGLPHEVVLLFDYGGVISNSPFPAIRRYTVKLIQHVFDVAIADGSGSVLTPDAGKPEKYANLFFDVIKFAESKKSSAAAGAANGAVVSAPGAAAAAPLKLSSWARLEMGRCSRLEFVDAYHGELREFLAVLAWTPENIRDAPAEFDREAVEHARRKYSVFGTPTMSRVLVEKFDAENFLCLIEKSGLRKNVLNMLHCLRAKSHQEIKIGVVTNNWEAEGGYLQQQRMVDAAGEAAFLPITCPNEWDEDRRNSFNVHSLFDSVSQSFVQRARKPSPELFLDAIAACGGPARNRHFFYFDDIQFNVKAAAALTIQGGAGAFAGASAGAGGAGGAAEGDETASTGGGGGGTNATNLAPAGAASTTGNGAGGEVAERAFEKAFFVGGGGADAVYKAVHAAISSVGVHDAKWAKIAQFLGDRIAPLFQPLQSRDGRVVPWEQVEEQNSDGNTLHLPIPINPAAQSLAGDHPNRLSAIEVNRLLYYLSRNLPQYFPMNPPPLGKISAVDLAEEPSLATSSGPVVVDYFQGGMSNPTYRLTLRTGSFVVRKQPKGALLKGAHDIKREYLVMRHLRDNSEVPVPKCLIYCDDASVIGTPFYVMRYFEGRIVRSLSELLMPGFVRRFSRSRQRVTRQVSAKPFIFAAIEVLAKLHAAPLPPFMVKSGGGAGAGAGDSPARQIHPVHRMVLTWDAQYHRGLKAHKLLVPNFEFLTEMLKGIFQGTNDDIKPPPPPPKPTLVHGDGKLDNLAFDYRSCEERRIRAAGDGDATLGKLVLQPRVIAVLDFELCSVGDPLTDLAYLSLFNMLPPPRGIAGVPGAHALFPTGDEILAHYCKLTGALADAPSDERRAQIFRVHQAAQCHKLCGIIHGVVVRSLVGNASDASGGKKLRPLLDYLAVTGIQLLGGEVSSISKL